MDRKEFYNSLSEDVKARLKACKTQGEMMKVLDAEKIALDPEVLEGVSGGFGDDIHTFCETNKYNVENWC